MSTRSPSHRQLVCQRTRDKAKGRILFRPWQTTRPPARVGPVPRSAASDPNRSEKTIEDYRGLVERLLEEWLDTTLHELATEPVRVANKHDDITRKKRPYMADGSMRTLRAIYNHARKRNGSLAPDHPADPVDWNVESQESALQDGSEEVPADVQPNRRLPMENKSVRSFKLNKNQRLRTEAPSGRQSTLPPIRVPPASRHHRPSRIQIRTGTYACRCI